MNFLSLAPTCSAASFSAELSMACIDAAGSIAATSAPAASNILNHDIAGKHCPNFVFQL